MNKNDFFNILMDKLTYIPEKKLQNIILHYEDIFDNELKNGKTESEIIDNFGDIDTLINNINSTDNLYSAPHKTSFIFEDADLSKKKNNFILNNNSEKEITESNSNINSKTSHNANVTNNSNVNSLLKLLILVLCLIIFFPIISTAIAFIIGLIGAAIGLCLGSIGILIGSNFPSSVQAPAFIANFPHSSLVFFCCGTICLSIFLFILIIYLLKAILVMIKKLFIKFT